MAKQSSTSLIPIQKRWAFMILLCIALSTAIDFFIRASFRSCNSHDYPDKKYFNYPSHQFNSECPAAERQDDPLNFMKLKLVLLVSQELLLSGGPLLLMELAFLLRAANTRVI